MKDKSFKKNKYIKAYAYYEDKLKIANDLGYDFVDDAIRDLYLNRKIGINEIAYLFRVTQRGISSHFERLKIKKRGRGGYVRKISKCVEKKILDELKDDNLLYLSEKYDCSITTILRIKDKKHRL